MEALTIVLITEMILLAALSIILLVVFVTRERTSAPGGSRRKRQDIRNRDRKSQDRGVYGPYGYYPDEATWYVEGYPSNPDKRARNASGIAYPFPSGAYSGRADETLPRGGVYAPGFIPGGAPGYAASSRAEETFRRSGAPAPGYAPGYAASGRAEETFRRRSAPAPGYAASHPAGEKLPGRGNPAPGRVSGRPVRWRVDFMDIRSGRRVSRDFSDRLIVGRYMPYDMESGRLYLSIDATVSRAQFCLYATGEGIMIENLSNVNITRKNGMPVWRPVRLEEGDVLQLGRTSYMVKDIRPAA